MIIHAHNTAPSFKNRLKTPRLVILEFLLEELSVTASPGEILFQSLAANYVSKRKKNIQHRKIVFDFKNDLMRQAHEQTLETMVRKLERYTFPHLLRIH
jgi:hypothetical protein